CLHERTGIPVALLRYHDFVPKPYLAFGAKLLRNGVDAEDVARANVAAVERGLENAYGLFRTIVHTDHGMPADIRSDFRNRGMDWCENRVPGSAELIRRWAIDLPETVEQHDLGEARQVLGWAPEVGFSEFLNDLKWRTATGEPLEQLWAPGSLNGVLPMPPTLSG
ncbi:MAG: NAD(P)-dependent oxidoreductase, partial [Armatimonadaceae bacterium]